MSTKRILLTGGCGYIGSHTCIELIDAGYDVVVMDNLCNSSVKSLDAVKDITNYNVPFHDVDLRDTSALEKFFSDEKVDAVIHFAGLKAVGESMQKPDAYYENNVVGSLNLLNAMKKHGIFTLVFSSSATVYGDPLEIPLKETTPTQRPTNPYGRTKLVIEDILRDFADADSKLNIPLLRYFNPVGAHPSGSIGEDPKGTPNNLMPYIAQVAVGKLAKLGVFEDDYPTPDGTGVRDYIHVVDLAKGHVAALSTHWKDTGVHTYNLGSGSGTSVLELIGAFEQACGNQLPYEIKPRREGDIATCYADPSLANSKLNWKATKSIQDMATDTWRWQSNNKDGFS